MIRRIGSKKAIIKNLLKFFPAHYYYIEPFVGGGSAFFYKEKAKFSFLNDIDLNNTIYK